MLVLSPKLIKLYHITLILEYLHWLKVCERSNTRFSLSHTNLSKLVNLLTSALLFHSFHIVLFGLLLLSPLVAFLLPFVLKLQIEHSFILLLPLQRHIDHRVTHSPILNSQVSDLTTSLFLKKITSSHCSFSSLVCTRLGYIRTDLSGIDQASLFHLIHNSFFLNCKCI